MSWVAIGTAVATTVVSTAVQAGTKTGAFAEKPEPSSSVGAGNLQPLNPELSGLLSNVFAGLDQGALLDFLNNPVSLTKLERASPVIAEDILGLQKTSKAERRAARKAGEPVRKFTFSEDAPFRTAMRDLESITPIARDLAETGFKTDVQPAIDLSNFLFENEFLPTAGQFFSGQTGLGSSDFGSAISREASRRAVELGALDIGLSEAAAGRRVQGIPLLGAAATAPVGFGLNVATDAGNIGEAFRLRKESTRPGGRILGALGTLGPIANQTGFFQPGFSPISQGTGQLGAAASALPIFAQGVSSFFQPQGGGSFANQFGFTSGANIGAAPGTIPSSPGFLSTQQGVPPDFIAL